MSLYKKRVKADELNKEGGYKNVVLFALKDDFLSMAKPTVNLDKLGGKYTITTTHTFPANKGFISHLSKKHSVTTKSASVGEDGSKSLQHTAEFILLGDSASTLEQMTDMLNDDLIFLFKDQDCLNTTDYVQFGDDCLSVDCTVEFDGKTTKEGLKEYKVTATVKAKKFFYQGTVTEAVDTTALPLLIEELYASSIAATSLTLAWPDIYVATPNTSFDIQRATVPAMTSPTTVTSTVGTKAITGLTTVTAYYFRVRAVNVNGNGPWSSVFGVTTV